MHSMNFFSGPPHKVMFRLTKLFQLLRLLRVSRIWRYMHQWDEMFNLPYDSALAFFSYGFQTHLRIQNFYRQTYCKPKIEFFQPF